ncbi:MAG: NAD/NADP octopine/nopaline dehydrogenase family protein [Spirochaetaceae bacterium]
MFLSDLLVKEATLVGKFHQKDPTETLVRKIAEGRQLNAVQVLEDLRKRESSGPTLIPQGSYGVAIPHTFSTSCKQLLIGVAVIPEGIVWKGTASKANVVFLVLGPPQTNALYLKLLSRIALLCRKRGFLSGIAKQSTPAAVLKFIKEMEHSLGPIEPLPDMPVFGVFGSGHGGMAMAGYLALTGCTVKLFNRTPEHIDAVRCRGGIDVVGEINGFAELSTVSSDPEKVFPECQVIMVVVPATAHRDAARILAPYLREDQIVVLNPGRTGGALEVNRILREQNPGVQPYLAEAETLLFASRIINPGQVRIFRIKNAVPMATLPAYLAPDILPVIRKALPQFVPGDNILKTSFDNIGAVFHPAITILNSARIEDTHGQFQYYVEGVTPAVAKVLEAIDGERVRVAEALGIRAQTAREWLYMTYDSAGTTLHTAMQANPGYRGINAPATIQHRYITEDVPTSLVPIASIGEMLGVATPVMHAMIDIAGAMHGTDYWRSGRTVDSLGIKGMSVKEIRFLVNGIDLPPR